MVELRGWRKSSYSGSQTNCVEVAVAPELVGVRDTKDRGGGTLLVPAAVWQAFVTALPATRSAVSRTVVSRTAAEPARTPSLARAV